MSSTDPEVVKTTEEATMVGTTNDVTEEAAEGEVVAEAVPINNDEPELIEQESASSTDGTNSSDSEQYDEEKVAVAKKAPVMEKSVAKIAPPGPPGGPPRGPPPKVDTSLRAYYELLRDNRELRVYFMSANFTVASEFMTLIATVDMIEDFQGAVTYSLYISGLVVIKQFTGVIVSMLFGGALADSRDRRKSMIAIDITSAFIALLNFIPLYFESILGVYIVVGLYQVMFGLYEPNRGAMLPTMMRGDPVALRQATVLTMTTTMGAMAPIGSALGGIVVTYMGVKACFILDSCAFLFSAFWLSRMRGDYTPEFKPKPADHDPNEGRLHRAIRMYKEGVQYLKDQFWGPLIFLRASIGFQFGAMDVLMVTFSESVPGNSTMNLAYLYLTLGLGSFVGPAGAASVNGGAPKLINFQFAAIVGFFINFVGNFGMGAANSLIDTILSVCIFNVCRASGGKIVMVNSRMLLQSFPEDNMLGRVMSLDYAVFFGSAALGAVVAGVLQDIVGLDATTTTYICSLVLGVASLRWSIYHLNEQGGADARARKFDERGPPGARAPPVIVDEAADAITQAKASTGVKKSKRTVFILSSIVCTAMMFMVFTMALEYFGPDASTAEISESSRVSRFFMQSYSVMEDVKLGVSSSSVRLSDFGLDL
mmetsp:Transcript_10809/g.15448  ORF Transcript_10809/g.15448 Transcript_10809/m.15448 type:complete len:652 (-) Transcript_10809:95-2050(-)